MKHQKHIFRGGLFALLLAGLASTGNAQIFNLTHANSAVTINGGSPFGMTSYTVDGANQVKGQWFYYRAGAALAESPLQSLGYISGTQGDARSLDLQYGNAQLSARVVYTLTGGSVGSGYSSISQTFSIINNSGAALALSLFDYSDYDLTGLGPQSLQFGTTMVPTFRTNRFTQTAGLASLNSSVASGTNFVSGVEAALGGMTLASLSDLAVTTLNNVPGVAGADVTGTFVWNVVLDPGASLTLSKLTSMQSVPEPSSLAFLGLGLAALLARKFRK